MKDDERDIRESTVEWSEEAEEEVTYGEMRNVVN